MFLVTNNIKPYIWEAQAQAELLLKQHSFGQRSYANGSPDQQRTGLIGELVCRKLFGLGKMVNDGKCDAGYDIEYSGLKIDVKTMSRKDYIQPYYVHNLMACQIRYSAEAYLFCSYNYTNEDLSICGWIDKKNFLNRAQFFEQGTRRYRSDSTFFETKADLFEIRQDKLYHIISVEDLQQQFINFIKNRQ